MSPAASVHISTPSGCFMQNYLTSSQITEEKSSKASRQIQPQNENHIPNTPFNIYASVCVLATLTKGFLLSLSTIAIMQTAKHSLQGQRQ